MAVRRKGYPALCSVSRTHEVPDGELDSRKLLLKALDSINDLDAFLAEAVQPGHQFGAVLDVGSVVHGCNITRSVSKKNRS
jgi:hypothetical protein